MFFNDNLNDSIPEDKIAYFIMSPINSDLCSVPGVSERNKNCFIDYGIVNTYQLFFILLCQIVIGIIKFVIKRNRPFINNKNIENNY